MSKEQQAQPEPAGVCTALKPRGRCHFSHPGRDRLNKPEAHPPTDGPPRVYVLTESRLGWRVGWYASSKAWIVTGPSRSGNPVFLCWKPDFPVHLAAKSGHLALSWPMRCQQPSARKLWKIFSPSSKEHNESSLDALASRSIPSSFLWMQPRCPELWQPSGDRETANGSRKSQFTKAWSSSLDGSGSFVT